MRLALIAAAAILPAACGSQDEAADAPPVAMPETLPDARPSTLPTKSDTGEVSAQPSEPKINDEAAAPASPPPKILTKACLMQKGKRLRMAPLRAVGTEPFWSARIDGRCVTYLDPSDQQGTRVWTRYVERPDGATWSGALGGQLFELRTRVDPSCSDGMSDKSYPLSVELKVSGKRRTGCAEPIGPSKTS